MEPIVWVCIVPLLRVVSTLVMKPGTDRLGMLMGSLCGIIVSGRCGMSIGGMETVEAATLRLVRVPILAGLPILGILPSVIERVPPIAVVTITLMILAGIIVLIRVVIALGKGSIACTYKQRTQAAECGDPGYGNLYHDISPNFYTVTSGTFPDEMPLSSPASFLLTASRQKCSLPAAEKMPRVQFSHSHLDFSAKCVKICVVIMTD